MFSRYLQKRNVLIEIRTQLTAHVGRVNEFSSRIPAGVHNTMTTTTTTTSKKQMKFGIDFSSVPDLVECVQQLTNWGYTYACIPLVHAKLNTNGNANEGPATGPLDRSALVNRADVILQAETWNRMVVKLSPGLDLDAPDSDTRDRHVLQFKQEVSYASYLNVSAIMFRLPLTANIPNLARVVNVTLHNSMFVSFFVQVPMNGGPNVDNAEVDTWKQWSRFSAACDYHKSVYLALELSIDLPDQQELDRWLGEPIKAVIVSTSIFLTNKAGFPVLSRPHQVFISKLFDLDACIFLSAESDKKIQPYFEYLSFIHDNGKSDRLYSYSYGYEDLLQVPLQPLINDLDNNVYAVFEQDPIKYQQYEKAITKALIDRVKDGSIVGVIIVCVVGAGRGPLVNASLKASENSKVPIKVYAIEKNENALHVLNYNNDNYWHNLVTVVGADMRTWKFEEKCDILVSELLGSFGDNELSPECLDGAQSFLKEDGICIPSSYTSYVSPLQSQTLYSNMKMFKCAAAIENQHENAEQIYVVNMRNMYIIAPAQPLFNFEHPKTDLKKNNDRYTVLTFDINQDCMLHGFAGYFNAVLYKDINISIEPSTFSTGMFSWYPAYIPIKSPVTLKKGEHLKLHFWRLSNNLKVWYEWSISEPIAIPIHNPNARSYSMQLH